MNESEIKKGIQQLCETSSQVKGYYDQPDSLIDALNEVPVSELKKCMDYYASRSGVIVDLRKEVIELLIEGKKLTSEILESIINKHRSGKENQFRAYKQWFSIFYPPITFYGHNEIRKFVENFIEQLISDLKLSGKVKSIYFDFQGARQQGSNRLWLAIYNKDQDSHSSGLQFFVEFYDGKVGYGVYRHSDKSYLKDRATLSRDEFDYKDLVNYFLPEKATLLENSPQNIAGTKVDKV